MEAQIMPKVAGRLVCSTIETLSPKAECFHTIVETPNDIGLEKNMAKMVRMATVAKNARTAKMDRMATIAKMTIMAKIGKIVTIATFAKMVKKIKMAKKAKITEFSVECLWRGVIS